MNLSVLLCLLLNASGFISVELGIKVIFGPAIYFQDAYVT